MGRGIAWRASIAPKPNDVEMFESMKAAGCREISVGIESADPAVLDLICGKASPEDGLRCLGNARAAGLRTRALYMTGLPGTTKATMDHDIRFLRQAPYDAIAVTVFVCAVFALFFIYPAMMVIGEAFRDKDGGFTLDYLVEVFRNPVYVEGLRNALLLGVTSTLATLLLAFHWSPFLP